MLSNMSQQAKLMKINKTLWNRNDVVTFQSGFNPHVGNHWTKISKISSTWLKLTTKEFIHNPFSTLVLESKYFLFLLTTVFPLFRWCTSHFYTSAKGVWPKNESGIWQKRGWPEDGDSSIAVHVQQMHCQGPVDQISTWGGFGAEPSCALYTAGSIYTV